MSDHIEKDELGFLVARNGDMIMFEPVYNTIKLERCSILFMSMKETPKHANQYPNNKRCQPSPRFSFLNLSKNKRLGRKDLISFHLQPKQTLRIDAMNGSDPSGFEKAMGD